MEQLSHFRPLGQQTNMTDEQMSDVRQGYPPPLHGLRVVLSILSFSQEVWKHQRFERSGSGRSWVTEWVHHTKISPVSDRAEWTWAQASGWVQTVHSNHASDRNALWEIINSRWCLDIEKVFHKMFKRISSIWEAQEKTQYGFFHTGMKYLQKTKKKLKIKTKSSSKMKQHDQIQVLRSIDEKRKCYGVKFVSPAQIRSLCAQKNVMFGFRMME